MPYTVPELKALLKRMDAMEVDGKEIYVFPIRQARQMVAGYITALEKLLEKRTGQVSPLTRSSEGYDDSWDFTLPQ